MPEKFRNKYRISSARLQNWDHGWNAAYFITICTHQMKFCFGNINNGKMELSSIGVIADILWYEIKNHKVDIELDAFVIMPNHVHGILVLNGNKENKIKNPVGTRHVLSLHNFQQQSDKTIGQQRFQNQGKNTISPIIGSYKSAVTKHARRLNFDFQWQNRFYDHVIKDEKSYLEIKKYITNNPENWINDKFNQQ